ncbi:hypothetical protein Aduo_008704 [Ancylostoma duodenale]
MSRRCALCQHFCEYSSTRRTSRNKLKLALPLALLVHAEILDLEKSKSFYVECCNTSRGKFICESHFVDAASAFVKEINLNSTNPAEVELRLRNFTDCKNLPEFLNRIQHYINFMDDKIVLDKVEAAKFLDDSLFRYGLSTLIGHEFTQEILNSPHNGTYNVTSVEVVDEDPVPATNNTSQPLSQQSGRTMDTLHSSSQTQQSISSTLSTDYVPDSDLSGSETGNPARSDKHTGPDGWNQVFLVDGNQLKELFRFCPNCGTQLNGDGSSVNLRVTGTAPTVKINCEKCWQESRTVPVWSGQKKAVDHARSRAFSENVTTAIAAITAGVRYAAVSRLAKGANIAFISNTTFKRISRKLTAPIMKVYERHRADVIEIVKAAYWQDGIYDGWDIAVDGAYDSRGHSASFCKVLAIDLKTKLCIHTEVVHCSETDGVSGRMEREGFRRLLLWFDEHGLPIRSVTSDRHAHFKRVLDEMNELLSWDMKWYFDEWHLSRYLVKALREASKRRTCTPLKEWIKSVKAHLKYAAEVGSQTGDGNNTKFFFNTCLYHIAGIHSWEQDPLTGPYTSCRHGNLDQDQPVPIPVGTAAYDKLAEIVLNQRFQNDICRLGPYGGTSQCETKNALDRLYCPKEVYFPPSTYSGYVAMSTLHLNTLRIAELAGERVVEIESLCQRRFNDHPSRIVKKSNVDHKWRREILDEYKRDRLYDLGNEMQTDDGTADLFEGFYDERLEEEIPEVPLDPEDDDGMESFLMSESDEEDIEMFSEVCPIDTILPVSPISGSHIT